jgi:hypothetical protein
VVKTGFREYEKEVESHVGVGSLFLLEGPDGAI